MAPCKVLVVTLVLAALNSPRLGRADLKNDALAGARRAARFYSQTVATEGGYQWRYSADLKLREGEGVQPATTIWVQPPGTPAVGEAFVCLYRATGDDVFRNAALAAAEALRKGQLRSGGWNAGIDFDPAARKRTAYRIDPPGKNQRNTSSLDDDKTQSALRFLMQLDHALKFEHAEVHETVTYALAGLLKAQYPSGGFPQVWDETHDPARSPALPARFPKAWRRTYPGHENYWYRTTLNDDLLPDVFAALVLADEIYGERRYRAAAIKIGDFLIAAQLPPPQPAWAQQYDAQMQPAWARKFEPPAVTGGESQGAIRVLLNVYRLTGDDKYLKPIPPALDYLRKSRLANKKLARFYELETNRPLYFTRTYELTYEDDDLPTHYSFMVADRTDALAREYQAVVKTPREKLGLPSALKPRSAPAASTIMNILAALDERGAWVTQGALKYQKYDGPILEMDVAVKNFRLLADFLAAQ